MTVIMECGARNAYMIMIYEKQEPQRPFACRLTASGLEKRTEVRRAQYRLIQMPPDDVTAASK